MNLDFVLLIGILFSICIYLLYITVMKELLRKGLFTSQFSSSRSVGFGKFCLHVFPVLAITLFRFIAVGHQKYQHRMVFHTGKVVQ